MSTACMTHSVRTSEMLLSVCRTPRRVSFPPSKTRPLLCSMSLAHVFLSQSIEKSKRRGKTSTRLSCHLFSSTSLGDKATAVVSTPSPWLLHTRKPSFCTAFSSVKKQCPLQHLCPSPLSLSRRPKETFWLVLVSILSTHTHRPGSKLEAKRSVDRQLYFRRYIFCQVAKDT